MGENLTDKVVAFIDLGTNSARLLIVRLNSNNSYSVLRRQKETVRLGQGEFINGLLEDCAMERAVIVCRQFVEISKSFGAEEIIAVATSATREASNKEEFLQKIKKKAGLSLEVISGTEEARLIYLGVSSGIHIGAQNYFFIDIGGGSTEIIVGDQFDYYILKSLKLGAIRTTNLFFPLNYSEQITEKQLNEIKKHVLGKYEHTSRIIKKYNLSGAFGSSGTIQALVEIKNRVDSIKKEIQSNDTVTTNELLNIIYYLCQKNLAERKVVPGINPERADIIVAGAIILYTILSQTGIKEIKASDRSLRDGLLIDYLTKIPGFPHAEQMPIRERSVRQLGRSCKIDEIHAENVIRLSMSLFDSSKSQGLHNLGDREREILEYSAFLHDVGQFISFAQHQNHSYYVITNAPLLGFNQNEIEMIGLITRHHRKKMPKKTDVNLKILQENDQNVVVLLSTFLRMAEHMERSHDGRIKSALFIRSGSKIVLNIEAESRCDLELWSLEEDKPIFKRVFGKNFHINIVYLTDTKVI